MSQEMISVETLVALKTKRLERLRAQDKPSAADSLMESDKEIIYAGEPYVLSRRTHQAEAFV